MATKSVKESAKVEGPVNDGIGNRKSIPIRVGRETSQKLKKLLDKANKSKAGRRVKADDVIAFGLELIVDEHLREIRERTLTNKDRLEILYRETAKSNKGLSREDFLGMLLNRRSH